MAEERALAPAEGPEDAPLDAAAMRSRVEQLSLKHRRRGVEEAESGVGDAEVMLCLDTAYQVAQEGMDVLDPSTAAISIDDLDALELLRKEVALAEEGNRKGLIHFEGNSVLGLSDSTDSCRNQSIADKDCIYEVLELGHQIGKNHELLIEVDEGNMEPKNLKIFPDDVCVDKLIERLRSSRHSFEYFNREEVIIAHLDREVDASIKISSDWPLCSYGLKLISIRNSGTHPTNIASSLLSKTQKLANGLEQEIRQHLVRFMDAVEEILIRELRSG
nr:unnamed protein product [Digitaria exilis]